MKKSKKILIVDDNKDLADGMVMLLGIDDYDAEAVYSGKDAVFKLKNDHYDLAFVDIKMSDMTGLHLLRACIKSVSTKFIFMTGFRMEQIISEIFPKYLVSVIRESKKESYAIDMLLRHEDNEIKIYFGDADWYFAKINAYCQENNVSVFNVDSVNVANNNITADVVVVNIHQPLIDVIVLLDQVRERIINCPLILILMNFAGVEGSLVSLNSYSLTGCLFKPIKPEMILYEADNLP